MFLAIKYKKGMGMLLRREMVGRQRFDGLAREKTDAVRVPFARQHPSKLRVIISGGNKASPTRALGMICHCENTPDSKSYPQIFSSVFTRKAFTQPKHASFFMGLKTRALVLALTAQE